MLVNGEWRKYDLIERDFASLDGEAIVLHMDAWVDPCNWLVVATIVIQ